MTHPTEQGKAGEIAACPHSHSDRLEVPSIVCSQLSMVFVECRSCGARGPVFRPDQRDRAIAAWNRVAALSRPSAPADAEEREAIEIARETLGDLEAREECAGRRAEINEMIRAQDFAGAKKLRDNIAAKHGLPRDWYLGDEYCPSLMPKGDAPKRCIKLARALLRSHARSVEAARKAADAAIGECIRRLRDKQHEVNDEKLDGGPACSVALDMANALHDDLAAIVSRATKEQP